MPSGKTHDKITWLLAPPLVYTSWYFSHNLLITILFTVSYFFSALMFSGDLDLVSVQAKRWGIMEWLWVPYRKIMKHRSTLSHGVFIGTIFRLIYVGFFMIIFYVLSYWLTLKFVPQANAALVNQAVSGVRLIKNQQPIYFLVIFLGLIAGSASHTWADLTGSFIKKFGRNFKRSRKKLRHRKK